MLMLAVCLTPLLSSCASVTAQRVPPVSVDIPATWSEMGASNQTNTEVNATSLAEWWTRFNDPLLTRLVTQALAANSSVNSAQAALRQARALRDVAAAGLLPAVGSSASAQQGTAGGNSTGSNFKVGLDASWEPDIFGGKLSGVTASDASVRASAASLADVQVSIAAEVALNYITQCAAQARLAIAESNLASQLETHQLTQWRLQAGLVSSLEVEQSLTAIAQIRAQLPLWQSHIAQSRHALALLTGQPLAALATAHLSTPHSATTGYLPQAADDLVLSFPAETLRQRPDIRAAEHRITAALARVAQADSALKPSFRLGGSLGLSALTVASLIDGAAVVSSLLAGVSLPIFDGGAARATVRAEEAALEQVQVAYRATVLAALQEVENALVALRSERQRLLRLAQAAEAAGHAALMARQRYDSGLVDFQVVLETQRNQLGTQDSVASSRADLAADHVRLYKALGGGWHPDHSNE